MNQYVTGTGIRELREKKSMTQAELAQLLRVSDKTVSKWETGKGYPDITLLEPLAKALDVSVTELLDGKPVENANVSANIMRANFYVCPICGNVLYSIGEAVIHCHGIRLTPAEAEPCEEKHSPIIETVEDEYYIRFEHEMTRTHHISFVAAVSSDGLQLVKMYPEWDAQCRFKIRDTRRVYFYCNKDGLFCFDCRRGRNNRNKST